MLTVVILNFSIFFSIIFAYSNFWHNWQFILQVYVGSALGCFVWFLEKNLFFGIISGLLFGSVFWFVFEGVLGNKLYRNFFYVDQNTIGKYFNNNFKRGELIMSLAKIFFLVITLALSLFVELSGFSLHKWIRICKS